MLTIQADLTVMDMMSGTPLGLLRLASNHEINPEHLAYHRKVIAERG
ncbi:hypothetical protein OG884_27835 [Streptosporangium sp. NBC_01755]|nr:hypothetical protein OG884_27835 [Streptosporangium sp. NBC_01755]